MLDTRLGNLVGIVTASTHGVGSLTFPTGDMLIYGSFRSVAVALLHHFIIEGTTLESSDEVHEQQLNTEPDQLDGQPVRGGVHII
jgi:hypothetical protein